MAWRFKASKYKNAVPIVPKPEACIRDINVGSYQTYGKNIASSAAFIAFNVDHNGSSVAVLPIDDCGRKGKNMPLLHAHSDTVTDMDFSPFHDGLLATGSQDCLVKIWHIPEKGIKENLCDPECTFSHRQRRVETVCFHPTADCLLTSTSYTMLSLWDITVEKELFSNSEHSEVIQSVSWKKDGTLIATSCKDKQVRILDPRSSKYTHICNSHQSIKDSRVIWLGDSNRILSSGFDSARQREIFVRDLRNFEEVQKSLTLDSSSGILIPLYDADTGMLFLAGKGDITISYLEVMDKEPYFIEGIRHSGEQTKGACLVPKRALAVMQAEVNRVLQLTSSSVIPITYQVPRKSYRDFHADLFPDTTGFISQITASDWFEGHNVPVPKISLDPSKCPANETLMQVHRGCLADIRANVQTKSHKIQEVSNFKSLSTQYKLEGELKEVINKDVIEDENGYHNGDSNKDSYVDEEYHQISVPPKPLPRISRTSSLSDSNDTVTKISTVPGDTVAKGSALPETDVISPPPRPVARPRTTSVPTIPVAVTTCTVVIPTVTPVSSSIIGVYKPRLGPKPFTPPKLNFDLAGGDMDKKETSDFSFDKVFSVPPVPGQDSNAISKSQQFSVVKPTVGNSSQFLSDVENKVQHENEINSSLSCEESLTGEPSEENLSDDKNNFIEELGTTTEAEHIVEELEDSNCSGSDKHLILNSIPCSDVSVPIAEHEKSDEINMDSTKNEGENQQSVITSANQVSKSNDSVDNVSDGFERGSVQRSSIAERRRMYENPAPSNDSSADKCKPASPTLLRRKSSFKTSSPSDAQPKETTKSVVHRQSSEHQADNKTPSDREKDYVTTPTPKRTSTVFGCVSKFRHLKVTPLHKSTHIENIRNISRQIPGECDGFCANPKRMAVPLGGAGGKIAVFEINKTGKLPDGMIPTLVNGKNIMDFSWDPFDSSRLAVACDDGTIHVWMIPDDGLTESTNTPHMVLPAHTEKIYFIKFHPLAKDVVASGSYDMMVKLWDLATGTDKIVLHGHTDQIFCFAWSPCGSYCSTLCKDGKLRIYNPRTSAEPMDQGKGPVGSRGARIVWALDGKFLVLLGFDKYSERQIMVFKADDLTSPLKTVGIDVSPAILIPFYDEDSSTLFLTGKGDSTIYAFEITEEEPYVCPLSHHRCNTLHQGLSFLPKHICDVKNVEFARALRLTNNTIEPLSFTVPRIKSDFFQDDLFPPTKITWKPILTSEQWFSGVNKIPLRISLKPEGMKNLSDMQDGKDTSSSKDKQVNSKVVKPLNQNFDISAKEKQEQIRNALSSKLEVNLKLEQDDMEGVDEKEWDD